MTAYDTYYAAIDQGFIPATVPVRSRDGSMAGISTQAVPVLGNIEAEALAFSDDPRKRAVVAIFAVGSAIEAIEQNFEDVEVVVR